MDSGVTIADACVELVDCVNRTAPEELGGAYFAIGTPAMRGNVLNLDQARRISSETFVQWTRRLVPIEGDLLLAREAPVGPVIRIPSGGVYAAGQRTMHLRANPEIVNPLYLYYLLISPIVQDLLLSNAMGSTVSHLRVADVRAFKLPPLPNLPEQKVIAEILGSLDDKIAANRRLAESANELAHALFSKFVAGLSESGFTFADLASVDGGGTPRTAVAEYWNGDVNWATPTDVTALSGPYLRSTSRMLSPEGFENCSSKLHPVGSILMTSRATIGAFAIAEVPMAVNQGFIVVNATDPDVQWWLFHEMTSRVAEFISLANGATFLELSRGRFKELKVRLPSDHVLKEFALQAEALHRIASKADVEASSLATIRDALLPQLMSGKLRVRDAEKQVEAVL